MNVAYHENIHSGTGQRPKERYESGLAAPIQPVSISKLMGRKGGASAFNTDELEVLQKVYQRQENLNESLLMEACELAERKEIVHIVYHIQQLQERR